MKSLRWLVLIFLLVAACDTAPAGEQADKADKKDPAGRPQNLPTTEMRIGDLRFELQVANDPHEREIGLMFVPEMPKKSGMIFAFPHSGQLSFWMKNTYIPLDLIFLDHSGKVLNIAQLPPETEQTVSSDGRAQWVIELNAGMASEARVKAGDVLMIPREARPEHAK